MNEHSIIILITCDYFIWHLKLQYIGTRETVQWTGEPALHWLTGGNPHNPYSPLGPPRVIPKHRARGEL